MPRDLNVDATASYKKGKPSAPLTEEKQNAPDASQANGQAEKPKKKKGRSIRHYKEDATQVHDRYMSILTKECTYQDIRTIAKGMDMSTNGLINSILEDFIKKHKKELELGKSKENS